jgi:hypothetical protein
MNNEPKFQSETPAEANVPQRLRRQILAVVVVALLVIISRLLPKNPMVS